MPKPGAAIWRAPASFGRVCLHIQYNRSKPNPDCLPVLGLTLSGRRPTSRPSGLVLWLIPLLPVGCNFGPTDID
jgi:hypothetical protein